VTTIGRYRLEFELGTGSMGSVFKAHDPVLDRTVAIKTIRLDAKHFEEHLQELIARFQHEARSAGRLKHPNIVTVYDYGEHEGAYYLVMEYVAGRTLAQRLSDDGALEPVAAAKLIRQTCAALQAAHAAGVVHRDIKPSNLMIEPDTGLVKVMDFGIAKLEVGDFTRTGTVMGTPSYMSPEQVMGKPVDGRSDLFSLGAVFFELLTGKKAFGGENIATISYRIVNEEPEGFDRVPDAVGQGYADVLKRALAKDPEQRFQTAEQFGAAIDSLCLGSSESDASASADTQPVDASMDTQPVEAPPDPAVPAPVFSASRRNRSRKMAGWLTAGAVIVAAGLFGYLQMGSEGTPPGAGVVEEATPDSAVGAAVGNGETAARAGTAIPTIDTATTVVALDTAPPPPPIWRLAINANPASSAITVDDSIVTASGDSIELVEGLHAVRIEATGFFPVDTMLDLQADVELEVALRRRTGSVEVSASIPGRISIDGRDRGASPFSGSGVRPGVHTVRFVPEIGDVLAQERQVEVKVGQTARVTFDITDGLLRIAVREPRWATVYAGDTRLGDTPLIDFRHPAGVITLRLVREGYRTSERQLRLEPGMRLEWVDVRLEADN
jgi:serine/threonine-protein kinase